MEMLVPLLVIVLIIIGKSHIVFDSDNDGENQAQTP